MALASACGGGGTSVTSGGDVAAAADAARAASPDGAPTAQDSSELYRDIAEGELGTDAELADAVTGAPGRTVDCAGRLPCRWVGADSGFAVAVLRADDTGRDGRLEMHLRIDSTHDTALGVALAADATDAAGRSTAPVRVALGERPVAGTLAVAAGERLDARVDFDAPSTGTTLPSWSLMLDDNGTARPASFANLPVGPLSGTPVDCGGTLPCLWTSDDGFASVELVGAGGFASARRLHVDFRIVTTEALTLVAGPDTLATGAGGIEFRARTQRLGATPEITGDGVAVPAGVPTTGRIDFFRTPGTPALLEALVLDLYRDAPVPRWRPRFTNVPALAP